MTAIPSWFTANKAICFLKEVQTSLGTTSVVGLLRGEIHKYMGKLYALFTIVSTLVRQFVLPNPFACFGDNAILINWIAEPILHVVAYANVGLFYIRGSEPLLGSIGYLFTYACLVGFLWVLGIFSFAWWWVLIVVIALIATIIGIRYLLNLLDGGF